ncbi:MAG: aromatic ring-hydroxylating dioxygenase subunit alpha [Gammaproteobacteria bacterium]|nr:MAG: aromatic ring-hydroxylating dioxygenase subunit alpha [Gammaproteobacteria bacterium]
MLFINNWYVAAPAAEVGDRPLRRRILGADLVLFRDADGVIHCLSDLCVHRGASLAGGLCTGGRIVCPQHGWEFDGDGRCALIPAGIRNPTEPPKRARVPAYPVQEKYGLVFVFLGDQDETQRPAIPDIMPEWDSGDWHSGLIVREKDVNYIRMIENYNDPCHVHYVHEFAKWLPKGVTIVDHELTEHYLKAWHAAWDTQGNYGDSAGLLMEYHVVGCVSRNTNYQPDYPPQIVTAFVTPVDEHNTLIHMALLMPKGEITARDGSRVRGATAEEHAQLLALTRDVVMDEDYAVLKTTRPVQAARPSEELLVETDRTLLQARRMTLAFAQRQGTIDRRAWRELADEQIRVLPCPAHRSDPKNWVHKTVPLLPCGPATAIQASA